MDKTKNRNIRIEKKTGISNGAATPTLMNTQQKTHKRRRQKRSRDHV
jgi:hypothetical protein